MNFRQTYLLFGLLAGTLLVLGVLQVRKRTVIAEGDYLLPSFQAKIDKPKTSDVNTVEIKRTRPKEEKIVFVRSEKGWEIQEPFQSPVRADGQAIDEMVRQLVNARKEPVADVKNEPALYGLENPAVVVTLKKGPDKSWSLQFGDDSPDNKVIYATSSEVTRPVALRRGDLEGVFKSVNDYRGKDLVPVTAFNTTALELTARDEKDPAKTTTIALTKTGETPWRLTKPFTAEADFDGEPGPTPSGVKGLLTGVGAVRVDSDADFVETDARDLGKYGLEENQATLRITATYTPNSRLGPEAGTTPTTVTETLLVGKKIDDKTQPDKYYARLLGLGERAIVRVDGKKLDPIRRFVDRPDLLRNRDLAAFDPATIDAIDVRNGKNVLRFRKQGGNWKLYVEGSKPVIAEFAEVKQILDAAAVKRQVRDFPASDRAAELGLAKPGDDSVVLTLWEDGFEKEAKANATLGDDKKDEPKKEEPKKEEPKVERKPDDPPALLKPDQPKLKLLFGKENRDKGLVAVRRLAGGEDALFEIPVTLFNLETRPRLTYFDKALPSFVPADAVKLVLVRGDGTFEIERAKKDEKDTAGVGDWTIKQPKELAGRRADQSNLENILRDLREMRPTAWVMEKPSDRDLDDDGLKSPTLRATVTLQKGKDAKETEERVYLFGRKNKEGAGLYAKLQAKGDDRDLIFTVRPEAVTSLDGELRDRVLFNFDTAKVKELNIVGWRSAYKGNQARLILERGENKSWKVKKALFDDFEKQLDATQVDVFLAELATMRVVSFLKGGPKTEHELEDDKRGVRIELTLDGEKTPLTLTVGKADGDKGFFGMASTLAGEAVVLPVSPFKKLLDEGVDFFKKK